MLVAGLAGFKTTDLTLGNPSACLLCDWVLQETFIWLVNDEILFEYKDVLGRLGVRRSLIGKMINILRERAELVATSRGRGISPDPGDEPFCACAEAGRADFLVTLNPKHFPQGLLSAHVIRPGQSIHTTARSKKK